MRETLRVLERASMSLVAENNNLGKPGIPKFDGYYDHWSMLTENLLRSKEY